MNNVGIKESFIKQFNSIESELVGNHLPWLKKLRTDAINEFKVLEVPNRYHEDWKYTSVDAILNQEYTSPISLDSIDKIDVEKFKLKECYNLIFINGKFSSKDSNLSQYSVDIKTAVLNSEGLASEFLSIKHQHRLVHTFYVQRNNKSRNLIPEHPRPYVKWLVHHPAKLGHSFDALYLLYFLQD